MIEIYKGYVVHIWHVQTHDGWQAFYYRRAPFNSGYTELFTAHDGKRKALEEAKAAIDAELQVMEPTP